MLGIVKRGSAVSNRDVAGFVRDVFFSLTCALDQSEMGHYRFIRNEFLLEGPTLLGSVT